jgi:hypothetical protein
MSDTLRLDYINSLPHPLSVVVGGTAWPLYDICVVTGALRFDVVGLLQHDTIGSVTMFRDADGVEHDPDTFYADYEQQEIS